MLPRLFRPTRRARSLIPPSPLLETLATTPRHHSTSISDPLPPTLDDHLLRILRSELTYLSDHRPPLPPPPVFRFFWVDDRPAEQWVRLRAQHDGGREDIKVDATMFDGAAPKRPGFDDEEPRLHISLVAEVSKDDGVLTFVCSAWPDYLEVEKVFPLLRRDDATAAPYMGRDIKKLDKKLQDAVYEYLEERGVNDELAEFLHQYMANKDKAELIRWLGIVGSYVEK